MSEVERHYDALARGCEQLVGRLAAQRQVVDEAEVVVEGLRREVELLTYSSAALQSLLNAVSHESLATVEALVTYGLRVVFEDQRLQLKLAVSTKRGVQSVEPRLVADDVEGPILDTFGGGPATLVAFLLRLMTVRRLKLAPVLLLDEPFAMVSAEYVENVGRLLRELAEKTGITLVMVTHEPRFQEFAHRAYEAVETAAGTTFKAVERGAA